VLTHYDTLAGDRVSIHFAQSTEDVRKAYAWACKRTTLALDTESTGVNPYARGWQLRTFQFGTGDRAFVIPARFKKGIEAIFVMPGIRWIGHNGPHDVRSIDEHLGYETGVVCRGETYLPGHHRDPRNRKEGGTDHGLKEQCEAFIDSDAGKWERALKALFKTFKVPIPSEVYKSGPRKGEPKFRNARLDEGWKLVDPTDPVYWAYAGADPLLTFRLWKYYQGTVRQFIDIYRLDHQVQLACDRLQRRGIRLDIAYTRKLAIALGRRATRARDNAAILGVTSVYSGAQVADALSQMGCVLTETTPKGALKTDVTVLKAVQADPTTPDNARTLIGYILDAKQCDKRLEAYAHGMLSEVDANGRIHPGINSLAARTARMSVSKPALQQLPTKDSEIKEALEELVNG
jgi:DNA polymerase-1